MGVKHINGATVYIMRMRSGYNVYRKFWKTHPFPSPRDNLVCLITRFLTDTDYRIVYWHYWHNGNYRNLIFSKRKSSDAVA